MTYKEMIEKAREVRKETGHHIRELQRVRAPHSAVNACREKERYISVCVNNYSTMLANARQKGYPKETRLEFLELAREWRAKFIEAYEKAA